MRRWNLKYDGNELTKRSRLTARESKLVVTKRKGEMGEGGILGSGPAEPKNIYTQMKNS